MSEGEIKKLKSRIQELAKKLGSITLLIRMEHDSTDGAPLWYGSDGGSTHCRSLVNAGGIDYLIQCRLHHAAREIRKKPHRQITAIALDCGFNSSQYFATVFGRRFKMTPRNYRKQES